MQDHPRRCGENRANDMYAITATGSPPQVRGKHPVYIACFINVRITPAGAGKTHNTPRRFFGCWGSPPQVRGKHRNCRQYAYQHGITPAGAGKTFFYPPALSLSKDHPRRCGENQLSARQLYSVMGSPPQVRGKHSAIVLSSRPRRITPAGAGKTLCRLLGKARS